MGRGVVWAREAGSGRGRLPGPIAPDDSPASCVLIATSSLGESLAPRSFGVVERPRSSWRRKRFKHARKRLEPPTVGTLGRMADQTAADPPDPAPLIAAVQTPHDAAQRPSG